VTVRSTEFEVEEPELFEHARVYVSVPGVAGETERDPLAGSAPLQSPDAVQLVA
jgi:hypothetical protein